MISLLVAHDPDRVIGKDNQLPWHIPEDLRYFKKMTVGKGIVMGRKTFESIGRPLPERRNIILTRNRGYTAEGADVVQSLDEAIALAKEVHEEVMIIGGAEIFRMTLPLADRLYITEIGKPFAGDTFFPPYSEEDWKLISVSEQPPSNGIPFSYLVYERGDKSTGNGKQEQAGR